VKGTSTPTRATTFCRRGTEQPAHRQSCELSGEWACQILILRSEQSLYPVVTASPMARSRAKKECGVPSGQAGVAPATVSGEPSSISCH
jgi:hypothetical protein